MTELMKKATVGDILISIILPLIGFIIGLIALFRGMKKRGFTMMLVSVISWPFFFALKVLFVLLFTQ